MPCEGAKGLLPGRGAPGRRLAWPGPPAEPAPGAPGRAPGRVGVGPEGVAPGRGAEVEGRWSCRAAGAGAAGRGAPGRGAPAPGVALRVDGADGAAAADGPAGASTLGAGVGAAAAGAGVLSRTAGAGAGDDGGGGVRVEGADVSAGRGPGVAEGRGPGACGRTGAAGRGAFEVVVPALPAEGAPLRAAGAAAGVALGASCSRRRRITGASRVEEGDLTNSPMSFAIERTALLSTPSSFASS